MFLLAVIFREGRSAFLLHFLPLSDDPTARPGHFDLRLVGSHLLHREPRGYVNRERNKLES